MSALWLGDLLALAGLHRLSYEGKVVSSVGLIGISKSLHNDLNAQGTNTEKDNGLIKPSTDKRSCFMYLNKSLRDSEHRHVYNVKFQYNGISY